VLDLVSDGETLKKHASLVKQGGTLVTTIHVADVQWFAQQGMQAVNIDMAATPQSSPEGLDQLAQMVAGGTLTVIIATEKPLEEAPQVLDEVKSGRLQGKVDLVV
jgi:NADPH:quinone reductase-like Zn-dependent oxidoreductase